MDLYGDRGNLLCLKAPEWRGHECLIKSVGLGEASISMTQTWFSWAAVLTEQALVYGDLITRG